MTLSQPDDCRKKGRPKLRWLDSVLKEDLNTLKVEAWWKKTLDRNLWEVIINEAKVHKNVEPEKEEAMLFGYINRSHISDGGGRQCYLLTVMMIILILTIIIKLKYKNLRIEIQRMWDMKCFVIPVIIGATGILSKSLQKYLETIPGQHSIDSLQKTAILGTSHIIRKVLQAET
jgi:hypothetical protein